MVASALLGICFVVQLVLTNTNYMTRVVPNWFLIRQVRVASTSQSPAAQAAWEELQERTLNPEQEQDLAELAIRMLRSTSAGRESSRWLKGLHLKGRMSAELESRYLEARLEISIEIVEVDGWKQAWINVFDHDTGGIGSLAAVLDKCWIEPSSVQLAQQDIWFRPDWDDGSVTQIKILDAHKSETQPSLGVVVPYEFVGDVRAKLWVFWSPMDQCLSPVSPRKLATDSSLDPRLSLVRTVDLSTPFGGAPQSSR